MEIILTEDGSNSIYLSEINESYHSSHGAVQESTHIFINLGLKTIPQSKINILELGFGTGLNAFLSLIQPNISITYTTFELFPLDIKTVENLNFHEQIHADKQVFLKLHRSPWGEYSQINDNFKLLKIKADFSRYDLSVLTSLNPTESKPNLFDLVYFDAFSPEKQPELWTEEIFRTIYRKCNHGAVLTTYCAKGQVRRNLQNAGFLVERLPGPPGKREVLRASKI